MTLLKNHKGQALVEMALSIMLLMLILVGIFEFGRAMYTKNTIINASRAGVRTAVVTANIANGSATLNNIPNNNNKPVYTAVDALLFPGFNKSLVTVTISGATSSVAIKNDTIKVKVEYTGFQSFTRLITITNTLGGETSMRYE